MKTILNSFIVDSKIYNQSIDLTTDDVIFTSVGTGDLLLTITSDGICMDAAGVVIGSFTLTGIHWRYWPNEGIELVASTDTVTNADSLIDFEVDIAKWYIKTTKSNVRNALPNNKQVVSREELIEIVKNCKVDADLNYLDVSHVTDMSGIFANSAFNGKVGEWDVGNVTNMSYMFHNSKFNGDIGKWDVSNVTDMAGMLQCSKFNGDIGKWDVSNVKNMSGMFYDAEFKRDISMWNVAGIQYLEDMYRFSNYQVPLLYTTLIKNPNRKNK